MSGRSLLWGAPTFDDVRIEGIVPYPFRFESQLAEGGITVIPPEGSGTHEEEPLRTGRYFRANIGSEFGRFYGRRSFGMNAGVPRSAPDPGTGVETPATVPGRLLVTAFSTFRYQFAVFATCPFWHLHAAMRISFDEIDGFILRRRVFGDDVVMVATDSAPLQLGGTSQIGNSPRSGRILNAEFDTRPGMSYRIWVDVMFRLVVHAPGVVLCKTNFHWVNARFEY